jgi:hypothetical protein
MSSDCTETSPVWAFSHLGLSLLSKFDCIKSGPDFVMALINGEGQKSTNPNPYAQEYSNGMFLTFRECGI